MADETRMSEEEKFLGVRTTIEPPSTETISEIGEIEVDIVDDRPGEDQRGSGVVEDDPELKQYGQKVQKRIKKLKYDYHEERRAKEESNRLANEAVNYTQSLQTENQRLIRLVQDSQTALTEQTKHRASASMTIAEENFKKAHESGDSDRIASAQKDLTNAQLAQAYAPSVSQKIIDNWKRDVLAEDQELAAQQRYAPPPPPEPDEKAIEWQKDNPWFGTDTEMTSLAYGVHERLIKEEGVDPDTDEYYQLIDRRMKEIFPTHFGRGSGSLVVETASRRKVNPVVAPASRNNGAIPRKVTLTQTQVRLAKRLGLTPQQYAVQLMKEMS
jgi:hypothetical protein